MSAVAVPALLAPILGPVIGGVILDGLSWRWIFFVNVPVCTIALLLAWRGMPDSRERGEKRLDVLGLALLSPALAAIVYGLSEAGSQGGFAGTRVIVALAIGAALLAAFAAHALRTTVEPIIDLRLFRERSFTASAALMFTFGLSIFGAMLLLPLYYQQARGQSALDAGLALAPQGLGTMIALVVVGRLTDKVGPRPIVLVGMVLATLGTIPYALVGSDTSTLALGASLIIRGAGLGAVIVPAMTAAYHDLRPEQIPRATSAMRIFQQIGASFGTAVLALILQHQTSNHAAGPAGLATAFGHTFWWAVGFTALACIPALLLPGAPATAPAAALRPVAAET
jgi:EmrB/QacA subfamily drug resistance transporter